VVLLHGKQGHGPRDMTLTRVGGAMQSAGMLVIRPEMAWSWNRLMDKHWSDAVDEIKVHIEALRARGAQRIVLAGQSLGSPAILAFAAKYHDAADALVLISPGHTPKYFYEGIPFAPIRNWTVRKEVDRARSLVAEGKGDQRMPFSDINQGSSGTMWATPNVYLSYQAPDSEAEMSLTAPRISPRAPVLWLMGKSDYLAREGRAYVFDRLPANPKSQYLEVEGGHFDAGNRNADAIVNWIKEAVTLPN
ncbi:MAG: alpha/beta fold hydrolase, partial [Burkholderiaceae bacterium]